VLRVVFIGIDKNKQAQCFWEIPRDKFTARLVAVNESHDQGVELDRPQVNLRNAATDSDVDDSAAQGLSIS